MSVEERSTRVAVVTGASSGIGAATAKTLATLGFHVVCAARRADRIATLAAEIGGTAFVTDVTDQASVDALAAQISGLGPVHVLVNNAGVSTTQRLLDVTEDDYNYIMDTNLRGAFFVAQAVGRHMLARGTGRVINVTSQAARSGGSFGAGVYSASKGFISTYTRSLAKELVADRIRDISETMTAVISVLVDDATDLAIDLITNRHLKRNGTLPTEQEPRCHGVYVLDIENHKVETIAASAVVMATGGGDEPPWVGCRPSGENSGPRGPQL